MKKDKHRNNSNVSRGYCGYYKGWYLRSMLEYKIARYLCWLETQFKHIKIEYEFEKYNVGDHNYIPDFYIFKFGKLSHIIEVKSNEKEAIECENAYINYFGDLGIKYMVVFDYKLFYRISNRVGITEQCEREWKENSIYDYSNENNPRFGTKASEETKRAIGKKTLKRNESDEWKLFHASQVKKSMTPEAKKKISDARKRVIKKRREKLNLVDPFVEFRCPICNSLITGKRKSQQEEYENNYRGCSYSCTIKLRKHVGIYTNKRKGKPCDISNRLKGDIRKIMIEGEITDLDIKNARINGLIANNSPLSIKTILKYFKTLNVGDILNG